MMTLSAPKDPHRSSRPSVVYQTVLYGPWKTPPAVQTLHGKFNMQNPTHDTVFLRTLFLVRRTDSKKAHFYKIILIFKGLRRILSAMILAPIFFFGPAIPPAPRRRNQLVSVDISPPQKQPPASGYIESGHFAIFHKASDPFSVPQDYSAPSSSSRQPGEASSSHRVALCLLKRISLARTRL